MAKIPADADILEPSDDHIFKTLLTHPDAEAVLRSLVSASIEREVVSVRVQNNELPITDVDEKAERLDVNCVVDGGDQINVEMQASRIEEFEEGHTGFKNRYVYYLADLHASQKAKGEKYHKFVRTYQVTFCAYTIFPERPDFVCRSALRTPEGELVSDQLNMVVVELSKLNNLLKKPASVLTPLEAWSLFFKYAPDPKHRDFINNIITQNEEIGMATELLMEISQDEHERARFRSRRKAETDNYSNIATAEERGEVRGEVRGEERKARKIAKNLLAQGLSVDAIAKATDLTVDDILRL